jgi:hypothetical protein
MIDCKHWTDCGIKRGGCCALNLHGGRPSHGVCGGCDHKAELVTVSRGLGDTVAKVADATGLTKAVKTYERLSGKPCGCAGRQALLNKLVPYKHVAKETNATDPDAG